LDRVGANYFTTLRIPVLRGRDISETDRAESQKVSIVNDAFARVHFDGHDPVGMLITTVDDGVRTTYEVVGLVPDARTHSVRDDVEPRFFIPAEQRPSSATTRTFVIRAAAGASGVGRAVRALEPALRPVADACWSCRFRSLFGWTVKITSSA
jgi:hypothetical protein